MPGMTVSPLKEVHFFDAKFARNGVEYTNPMAMRRFDYFAAAGGDPVERLREDVGFQASIDRIKMIYDDNEYFGHFARIVTQETRTLCEITPRYSVIGRSGFEYVRDMFATQRMRLRIVFVMRDPVERLWSQLRHLQQGDPRHDILRDWQRLIEDVRITERTDYAETVAALDATFPQANLLYLFYEDLFAETTLRRLGRFAGLEFVPSGTEPRRNVTTVTLPMPEPAREAFATLLAPQYAFCRERFGPAVPQAWRG